MLALVARGWSCRAAPRDWKWFGFGGLLAAGNAMLETGVV